MPLFFATPLYQWTLNFFVWLKNMEFSSPEVSIESQLVIRALTFIITFFMVRCIFEYFQWFNHKVMHIVYVIVSTVVSCFFCYVFHFIETNAFWIVIGVVLAIGSVITWIMVSHIKTKKHEEKP